MKGITRYSYTWGADIHKICKTIVEATPHTYTTLKNTFTMHCEHYANPDYKRFLLRQTDQKSEESVDAFYAWLKKPASTCALPDEEDEVGAQFIQRCASSKFRKRILQEPNMGMQDILTLEQSKELSKARAAAMEQPQTPQVKAKPATLC
ncbi:hypothetical protein NDU88_007719 [Pleurodeles waltl]|uniref:Retrotransposon gag domain-containing protein n=1 Tax=Pleurodeles waltl TaxID=8319 RepID=A0AAV7PS88_PLEWA|nr:hypothetical protein NDU88_007719 [Pleurodeles waltl]